MLPPSCASRPARCGEVRDERRGGRFPVGPGDGDERRTRREAAALAAEQLDVADHLDGGFSRERNAPVRARMGERNAGREHQRRDLRPIELPQVGGRNAGCVRLRHALRIVVEGDHVGAAGEERARAHQSRAAQPEHGDLLTGEGGNGDHGALSAPSPPPPGPRLSRARVQACGEGRGVGVGR